MKVFLSWSGARSKVVAEFLAEWLADVIQSVQPWMSKKDIEAGRRWDGEIASQLDASDFGVVCLTPENREAPWIMFEAGALAKRVGDARVVPYLIGMDPSGIGNTPLASFQAKVADKAGTFDVLTAMNTALQSGRRTTEQLQRSFSSNWERLLKQLESLPPPPPGTPGGPGVEEMVKDILATVRGLGASLETTRGRSDAVLDILLQRSEGQGVGAAVKRRFISRDVATGTVNVVDVLNRAKVGATEGISPEVEEEDDDEDEDAPAKADGDGSKEGPK